MDTTKIGRSPDGSGHSPKGGAASSTASPAKPSVPNAECASCGAPLTIPPERLAEEPDGFNCAGCYFVGAPQ
jgi:hypothetical protein